jgi:hypothetical protein
MLTYNGSIPGPTLRVREGSEVIVDIENRGDMEATVHWHGLRLENRYDGTHETQRPMGHGERYSAHVAFPDPGVYWYHPVRKRPAPWTWKGWCMGWSPAISLSSRILTRSPTRKRQSIAAFSSPVALSISFHRMFAGVVSRLISTMSHLVAQAGGHHEHGEEHGHHMHDHEAHEHHHGDAGHDHAAAGGIEWEDDNERSLHGTLLHWPSALYPDFTAPDLIGPYEVISRWPNLEVHFLATSLEPVRCDQGLIVIPTDTPATLPDPDLIVVGGSGKPVPVMSDQALIEWLRTAAPKCEWTASVCTGAGL